MVSALHPRERRADTRSQQEQQDEEDQQHHRDHQGDTHGTSMSDGDPYLGSATCWARQDGQQPHEAPAAVGQSTGSTPGSPVMTSPP